MSDWRERAGRILLDPNCAQGHPIQESLERRWLEKIETELAVSATNDTLRQLGRDVKQYLGQTCEHHWHSYEGDDDIPAHRQCMWCSIVEFTVGHDEVA